MSNGERGPRDGQPSLPRPTFGLFFPIFSGRPTFSFGPGGRAQAALPGTTPIPTDPRTGIPDIRRFPVGTPANDPVFRVGIGPRIFNIGGLIITAAQLLAALLEKKQLREMQEELERQRDNIEGIERRGRADTPVRTIGVEPIIRIGDAPISPDRLPAPIPTVPPQFPLPDFEFPIGIPPSRAPLPEPMPEAEPVILPVGPPDRPIGVPAEPRRLPVPTVPPLAPAPVPSPVDIPISPFFITPLPFSAPGPAPFSPGDPILSPIGDPDLLTPFETPSVPSGPEIGFVDLPIESPLPQADTAERCKPQKCDDDLDEPRTECFKGLYREGFRDTDFTQWVEIDCATGREL